LEFKVLFLYDFSNYERNCSSSTDIFCGLFARKTFVNYLSEEMDLDVTQIGSFTDHKNDRTLRHYKIKDTSKKKRKMLKNAR